MGYLFMLLTRKRLKPKYSKSAIIKPIIIHGVDGVDGLRGIDGKHGLDGNHGIDGKSIKGAKGDDGQKGESLPATKGKDGKDAKTVERIEMFSRRMITYFDDGSSISTEISRPAGTVDNPGQGGGQEPPVQDVRGGTNIEVLAKNRTFTVNEKANTIGYGLPYSSIPASLSYTVPINQHHLTLGEVTINGTMLVTGEMAVI